MDKPFFIISKATQVTTSNLFDSVLKRAREILQRDINKVTTARKEPNEIHLQVDEQLTANPEEYQIDLHDHQVIIKSGSNLGVMYGALAVSRSILKIDDFWYWMDTPIQKQAYIS